MPQARTAEPSGPAFARCTRRRCTDFAMDWVIPGLLARGCRPGYTGERAVQVSQDAVDAWLSQARELGIRSIICLLADDQLTLYAALPTDLISYYRENGSAVEHIPARDHQHPPLTDHQLAAVWEAYQRLPKPVLVHCSAGIDRTGRAIEHIIHRLNAQRAGE